MCSSFPSFISRLIAVNKDEWMEGMDRKKISFGQLYSCQFELKVWNLIEYFVNYKY